MKTMARCSRCPRRTNDDGKKSVELPFLIANHLILFSVHFSDWQEFYMDHNSLASVPTNSLNGPVGLKRLSLTFNHILTVKSEAFSAQPNLERIDLKFNRISTIEGGAFANLNKIKEINLAGNRLSRMNSDVFQVIYYNQINVIEHNYNFIRISC